MGGVHIALPVKSGYQYRSIHRVSLKPLRFTERLRSIETFQYTNLSGIEYRETKHITFLRKSESKQAVLHKANQKHTNYIYLQNINEIFRWSSYQLILFL